MTVEANNLAPRRSRLLYPGFILSLALNLLFLGGVAAAVWHHHNMEVKRTDYGLMRFAKELPPARREAFRQQVANSRASLNNEWETVRAAWAEANGVLTDEPFDKGKFKAAMDKQREAEKQYKAGLNNNFADMAASLSPDERRLLKSWREKRKPWFSGKFNKAAASGDGTKAD